MKDKELELLFLNKQDYKIIETLNLGNIPQEHAIKLYVENIRKRVQEQSISNHQSGFIENLKKAYECVMIKIKLMGLSNFLDEFARIDKFSQLSAFDRLIKARTYVSLCNHKHAVADYVKMYDIKEKAQNIESGYIDEALLILQQNSYNIHELGSLYMEAILNSQRQLSVTTPTDQKSKDNISNLKALILNSNMVLNEIQYYKDFELDELKENKHLVCATNFINITETDKDITTGVVSTMIRVLTKNDSENYKLTNLYNTLLSYREYLQFSYKLTKEGSIVTEHSGRTKDDFADIIFNATTLIELFPILLKENKKTVDPEALASDIVM